MGESTLDYCGDRPSYRWWFFCFLRMYVVFVETRASAVRGRWCGQGWLFEKFYVVSVSVVAKFVLTILRVGMERIVGEASIVRIEMVVWNRFGNARFVRFWPNPAPTLTDSVAWWFDDEPALSLLWLGKHIGQLEMVTSNRYAHSRPLLFSESSSMGAHSGFSYVAIWRMNSTRLQIKVCFSIWLLLPSTKSSDFFPLLFSSAFVFTIWRHYYYGCCCCCAADTRYTCFHDFDVRLAYTMCMWVHISGQHTYI